MTEPLYKRVMLKLSGESLLGNRESGIDPDTVAYVASEIASVRSMGVGLGVVVGGGNLFRGVAGAAMGMDRSTADYMGMLATVMNALSLQNALQKKGVAAQVLSAIPMESVCETYVRRRALYYIQNGSVVILAAGTGNPFFTTDTAAALRASEMGCDVLIKATKVDGVYDRDPMTSDEAVRFERLSYLDVLAKDLKVMDASAISLARENKIPILVFSVRRPGVFKEVLLGRGQCTIITEKGEEYGSAKTSNC
jgi:uridylate kinase